MKVILHCFSMAERVDECLAHPDWWFSFAGNITYPKNEASARGDAQGPGRRGCWSRPTRRTSRRSRCAASATCPPTSCMTAQAIALERRVSYHDFNLEVEAAVSRCLRLVKLGQNFLVDRNILDVIERLAALSDGRCRAGGRRRSGGAVAAARASVRRSCTWSSSTAASRANLRALLEPYAERRAAHGRRARSRSRQRSSRRPTKMVANLPTASPRP